MVRILQHAHHLHGCYYIPQTMTLHSKILLEASLNKHLQLGNNCHRTTVPTQHLFMWTTASHRSSLHDIEELPSRFPPTVGVPPLHRSGIPRKKEMLPLVKRFLQSRLRPSLHTLPHVGLDDIVNMVLLCWHSSVTSVPTPGAPCQHSFNTPVPTVLCDIMQALIW